MNAILAPGPFNAANRAANGPNYGEGEPYFPDWKVSELREGRVLVIPANYGQDGGQIGYNRIRLNQIGNSLEPTSLQHRPLWNILTPTINWHLEVLTKQQLAAFENSVKAQPPQIPMDFVPPGTASLMK